MTLRDLICGGPRNLQQINSIYLKNRDVLQLINSINDLLKSNNIPFVIKIININDKSRNHDLVYDSLENCVYRDANNDFLNDHLLDRDFETDECCVAMFSVESSRKPKCISSILILRRNENLEIESKTVDNEEKWTREDASIIIKNNDLQKVSSRLHRPRKFLGIGLNKLLRYVALHIVGKTQKNFPRKDVISLAINPISVYLLQNLIQSPKQQLKFHFYDDFNSHEEFQRKLLELNTFKQNNQKVPFDLIKKIFDYVYEIDIKIPMYKTKFLEINQRQIHEALNNVIKKYNNK